MRVGFDARWYNGSGVGAYVTGLLQALAQRRQDLDLVVYEDVRNPVPDLATSVERIPLTAGKYSVAEQLELKQRCVKDGLDVFHSPFYVMPLLAPCPVVVTVHDVIPFLFRINSWPKQALVKLGYRVAASRAAQIIAVSRNTAADLRKILKVNPKRIHVVHNGADTKAYHVRPQPREIDHLALKYGLRAPYVVVASAGNWRTKNLPNTLKAIELAREKSGKKFQAVVYGPAEGLRQAEAELGRSLPNCVSAGYVPAAELGILFRNAHAFLMPSLYEGFGLPVLEAMSCGCAVITSTGGSLPEIAGNGAQLFAPMDINGMAQVIASLLLNPAEFTRCRERARTRAADFSWSKAAEQTVSVYHLARRRDGVAEK